MSGMPREPVDAVGGVFSTLVLKQELTHCVPYRDCLDGHVEMCQFPLALSSALRDKRKTTIPNVIAP